jgi:hypothetical protein
MAAAAAAAAAAAVAASSLKSHQVPGTASSAAFDTSTLKKNSKMPPGHSRRVNRLRMSAICQLSAGANTVSGYSLHVNQ